MLKTILRDQKGQSVWEYVVTIIGAVALGFVVSSHMRDELTSANGAADLVIQKVTDTIDGITTP